MKDKDKEKTIDLLNDVNTLYITKLYGLVHRLKYELKEKKGKSAIVKYQAQLQTLFSFYRDMVNLIDYQRSYITYRDLNEGETYKSIFDKDDYVNECIGVAIYKEIEFPIFLDDYGMQEYVEYKDFEGKTKCASKQFDWDYAYESDVVLSYLETIHTIKQCEEAMKFIETHKVFKNF